MFLDYLVIAAHSLMVMVGAFRALLAMMVAQVRWGIAGGGGYTLSPGAPPPPPMYRDMSTATQDRSVPPSLPRPSGPMKQPGNPQQ